MINAIAILRTISLASTALLSRVAQVIKKMYKFAILGTQTNRIMKFLITSDLLKLHLQTISKVINPKSVSTIPVLGNILFELTGNVLTITASDVNSRLTSHMEVQNEGDDGAFMIQHQFLISAISELPDQPITLEVENDTYKTTLHYANGQYNFLASSADTYPAAFDLDGQLTEVSLPAKQLLAGLEGTMFAASDDERRPIMTGVLLDMLADKIVYVASDGRILVRRSDYNIKSDTPTALCLPAKLCQLLVRSILSKEDGDVRISYDGKFVQINLEQYSLTARLLEGKYPNYNSVIPPSSPYTIITDRLDLLYAAKRASLCSNKASRLILLEIQEQKIRITANDLGLSTAAEAFVPCQSSNPETQIRIAFDFDMLQSVLESLKSEQITLSLGDQTRAGVITPNEELEGIETLALITPLRLVGVE